MYISSFPSLPLPPLFTGISLFGPLDFRCVASLQVNITLAHSHSLTNVDLMVSRTRNCDQKTLNLVYSQSYTLLAIKLCHPFLPPTLTEAYRSGMVLQKEKCLINGTSCVLKAGSAAQMACSALFYMPGKM